MDLMWENPAYDFILEDASELKAIRLIVRCKAALDLSVETMIAEKVLKAGLGFVAIEAKAMVGKLKNLAAAN